MMSARYSLWIVATIAGAALLLGLRFADRAKDEPAPPLAAASPAGDVLRSDLGRKPREGVRSNGNSEAASLTRRPRSASAPLTKEQSDVETYLGDALSSLGLSNSTYESLRDLIAERETSGREAHALAREHTPVGRTLAAAAALAQAPVDVQIRELVGEEKYPRVLQLLRESIYHGQTQTEYGPEMSAVGAPMTPEQSVQLGHALYESFSMFANPQARELRRTLNPATGLSLADESVLRSSAAFLNAQQLAVLRERLSRQTSTLMSAQKN